VCKVNITISSSSAPPSAPKTIPGHPISAAALRGPSDHGHPPPPSAVAVVSSSGRRPEEGVQNLPHPLVLPPPVVLVQCIPRRVLRLRLLRRRRGRGRRRSSPPLLFGRCGFFRVILPTLLPSTPLLVTTTLLSLPSAPSFLFPFLVPSCPAFGILHRATFHDPVPPPADDKTYLTRVANDTP
jgi:hypothetical protein